MIPANMIACVPEKLVRKTLRNESAMSKEKIIQAGVPPLNLDGVATSWDLVV